MRVKKENGIAKANSSFIVKVQVPNTGLPGLNFELNPTGDMLVYNEDRSVLGYIPHTEGIYGALRSSVVKEGYCGIKAYFRAMKTSEGSLKINPERMVEIQPW